VPSRLLDRFVAITAVGALAAYVALYWTSPNTAPIRSDAYSYFVYLPAWFLHHDPTLQAVADDCCGGTFPEFTSIVRWPDTDRWVNPHPIGVALLLLPSFAAAHALTRWSNLPLDGFSLYYQHAAGLTGVAALLAGLAILRGFLRRHFGDGVTLATLTTIAIGTNLFHYGTRDSTFSHVFSFFLIAALLDLTDRWWARPSWTTSLWLAVVGALIVLVRHPNAVYLSIVPLWNPAGLRTRWRRLLAMSAVAAWALMPQVVIYRQATGRWFASAYGQVGRFDFTAPRFWSVLFGVQKGLFFWSPALLFAVAGFFVSRSPIVKRLRVPAAATFLIQAYLIASWSDWQLGASFGHRGFTDGLAFAAVFTAGFFDWASRRSAARVPVALTAAALIALSCAQMLQYWLGVLPMADITWEQYRQLFLRFS
jgi:hypothetical protein